MFIILFMPKMKKFLSVSKNFYTESPTGIRIGFKWKKGNENGVIIGFQQLIYTIKINFNIVRDEQHFAIVKVLSSDITDRIGMTINIPI